MPVMQATHVTTIVYRRWWTFNPPNFLNLKKSVPHGAWREQRKVLITNQRTDDSLYPEVILHNKKLPGNKGGCWKSNGNNISEKRINSLFVFRLNNLPGLWLYCAPVQADMDEYDELFEIQDDFEDQFADELEVLAQMEGEEPLTLANRLYNLSLNCYINLHSPCYLHHKTHTDPSCLCLLRWSIGGNYTEATVSSYIKSFKNNSWTNLT